MLSNVGYRLASRCRKSPLVVMSMSMHKVIHGLLNSPCDENFTAPFRPGFRGHTCKIHREWCTTCHRQPDFERFVGGDIQVVTGCTMTQLIQLFSRQMNPLCSLTVTASSSDTLVGRQSLETECADNALKIAVPIAFAPKKKRKQKFQKLFIRTVIHLRMASAIKR